MSLKISDGARSEISDRDSSSANLKIILILKSYNDRLFTLSNLTRLKFFCPEWSLVLCKMIEFSYQGVVLMCNYSYTINIDMSNIYLQL